MSRHSKYLKFLTAHDLGVRGSQRALRPDVCEFIADVTSGITVTSILEIGRAVGHSFGFFRYLYPNAHVVSIDINHVEVADEVAALFDDNFLFVDGDSSSLENMKKVFDVVLIDGDHSYKGCKKDWDNIQMHIRPGSVVLFDDLGHGGGCGNVFHELTSYRKATLSDCNSPYFGVVYI